MIKELFWFITLDVLLLAFLLDILKYLKDCIHCGLVLGTTIALFGLMFNCVLLFNSFIITVYIPIYGSFDVARKALFPENSPLNTINQTRKEQENNQ